MASNPALEAGAQSDKLLQDALKRFFPRAKLDSQSNVSESSAGRLEFEPTNDPSEMGLRWFGQRHILRTATDQPFSTHEKRFARAIGSVLWARHRAIVEAIVDPHLRLTRSDLFQGAIEDRYVGAFVNEGAYRFDSTPPVPDRVAPAIEVLRLAALSSYENRPISSGVILVDSDQRPVDHDVPPLQFGPQLTSVKAFYRLCDGVHTALLVNREGQLVDVVDVVRWAMAEGGDGGPEVPAAQAFWFHALATRGNRHVCVVLSPSHEIKVFAEGAEIFAFRHGAWHLLDLEAKYARWNDAVHGNDALRRNDASRDVLAKRLFQAALDLADERHGALFVVLRDLSGLKELVAPEDRLQDGAGDHGAGDPDAAGARRALLSLVAGKSIQTLDASILAAIATMDGATVFDTDGRVLATSAILRHAASEHSAWMPVAEGARTTAAIAASRFAPVLKVSEDGLITFFDGRDSGSESNKRIWDI